MTNSLSDGVLVPHARRWVLRDNSWLWWPWNSRHDSLPIYRRTVAVWSIWLSQTVLEVAHDAFIDVLGYKAATISHYIGVPARPIAEILEDSRLLVSGSPLKLVILIDIQRCGVISRLVASPRGGWRHIFVTDESSVAMEDISVATHAVTPVCRMLYVFCSSECGLYAVYHNAIMDY